jgi:hypothetical protein
MGSTVRIRIKILWHVDHRRKHDVDACEIHSRKQWTSGIERRDIAPLLFQSDFLRLFLTSFLPCQIGRAGNLSVCCHRREYALESRSRKIQCEEVPGRLLRLSRIGARNSTLCVNGHLWSCLKRKEKHGQLLDSNLAKMIFTAERETQKIPNRSLTNNNSARYDDMCRIGIGSRNAESRVVGKTFWTPDNQMNDKYFRNKHQKHSTNINQKHFDKMNQKHARNKHRKHLNDINSKHFYDKDQRHLSNMD